MDKDSQAVSDASVKVTPRSSKSEILSAYEELLQKFQENAETSQERQISHNRQQENQILEEAIAIEEKRLSDIHKISSEADSLANLIVAHKEKKKQLEEESEIHKKTLETEIASKKEEWLREENEYAYEIRLKRKKEEDDYLQKKAQKERELQEREEKLAAQEKELEDLRKRAINFEKMLNEAVTKAKQETEAATRKEEDVKAKILAGQNAAEKRIAEMTIESIKMRLQDQEQEIKRLKIELEIANRGVKDIAVKVIEGNARIAEQHRSLRFAEKEKSGQDEKIQA